MPVQNITRGIRYTAHQCAVTLIACLLLMFTLQLNASEARSLDLQQLTDELALSNYVVQVQPDEGEDNLSEIMSLPDNRWSGVPQTSRSLGRDYGTTWFRVDLTGTNNLKADSAYYSITLTMISSMSFWYLNRVWYRAFIPATNVAFTPALSTNERFCFLLKS
ncbi:MULTISPECIES: hypothetical protein [Thalassolituus]|uniref:hypothetical protein n=1 Tax=Thalassolituus TaxID=187492 RepID=UPI002647D754|nr:MULTISPECIES: hypothetical protein [Thalassolituus]